MSEYKIEKGMKMPERKCGAKSKYPFGSMKIGDSFVADVKSRITAYQYGRRHKMKFASRQEGESFRIWRIK